LPRFLRFQRLKKILERFFAYMLLTNCQLKKVEYGS